MMIFSRGLTFYISGILTLMIAATFPVKMALADPVKLDESTHASQVFEITSSINVSGKIITAQQGGTASSMNLNADARMKYQERKISGAGRDAEAFRSMRIYETAESTVDIHKRVTQIQIRETRKKLIANGKREGIKFYSPEGALRYSEIELLTTPGDSLSILSLLPGKEISAGDKWDATGWATQMLVGMEAVLKSNLTCELKSIENQIAKVEFSGKIEGATLGASSEVEISGHYLFNMEKSFIEHAELVQVEKRSVGSVSPGLEIKAKVSFDRQPVDTPEGLKTEIVDQVPLEADPSLYLLEFQSPWKVQFLHDRNWHIFHKSDQFAVLRLLDKGSLVAQCNLSPIGSVAAGSHTPDEIFQNDIRASLKEKLISIEKAEQVKTEDGRYLYRVTVIGEVNKLKLEWVYYLCASPSGQQVSFVFSYERDQKEKLMNRDLDLVKNLRFLENTIPQEANLPK